MIPTIGRADGRTPLAGGTTTVIIAQPGSYVLTGNITVGGGSASTISRCQIYHDAAINGTGIVTSGSVYRGNAVSNFSTLYSGSGIDGRGNF